MADNILRLPVRWQRSRKVSLKLKFFPRGTEDCPRPHVVFVVIFPWGREHLLSSRCFVKPTALYMLDDLLKMFHGDFVPEDIKGLRSRLRSRIRRFESLPKGGGGGGGTGSTRRSTGTH